MCILAAYWAHTACILGTYWVHTQVHTVHILGAYSVAYWALRCILRCILSAYCIHTGCILHTYWVCILHTYWVHTAYVRRHILGAYSAAYWGHTHVHTGCLLFT